jgi:hypothetical protein
MFILISAKSISDKPFRLAQTVRKLVPLRPFRFKKLDAISAEKSWRLWRIQPLKPTPVVRL